MDMLLRQTSRWAYRFNVYRSGFGRVFDLVKIRRTGGIDSKTTYDISLYTQWEEDLQKCDCPKYSPSSTSMPLWLVKTFPKTHIKKLELKEICFNKEYLGMEQPIAESNLKIDAIDLVDSNFGANPVSTIRFLKSFHPSKVAIHQYKGQEDFRLLFTNSFFTYINTLRSIEIATYSNDAPGPFMKFPEPVHKMPKEFITNKVFFMHLSTIAKIIHKWNDDEQEIDSWLVSLQRHDCPNAEHLAKALNLPYETSKDFNGRAKITLKNCNGKVIDMYTREPAQKSYDTIELIIKDGTDKDGGHWLLAF